MPPGIHAAPSFLLTLEMINYVWGPSNLSPVTVSLFHANKAFPKQLPLTPERISIATLQDSHAPLFTKCLESDIVARSAALSLELPHVGKHTWEEEKHRLCDAGPTVRLVVPAAS